MRITSFFILAAVLTCGLAYGQSNTFPASGSVGIGTLTPEENWKLDVNGLGTIGNAGSARLYLGTVNPTTAFLQSRNLTISQKLLFSASSYNFDVGNVGVGTSNPVARMDVRSELVQNEYGIITPVLNVYSSGPAQPGIGGAIALGGKTGLSAADYPYAFILGGKENNLNYASYFAIHTVSGGLNPSETQSANYERFRVNSNGNVGIGTANPTEKLSVNGNIRAKEIKVEVANWPDYVFDTDYQITSLADLEKFIQVNKHLPEMPSAREVEAKGLNLGEMNKKLLQKVEELTLHLIEKDKQLINQEKRLLEIENLLRNTQNKKNEDDK